MKTWLKIVLIIVFVVCLIVILTTPLDFSGDIQEKSRKTESVPTVQNEVLDNTTILMWFKSTDLE